MRQLKRLEATCDPLHLIMETWACASEVLGYHFIQIVCVHCDMKMETDFSKQAVCILYHYSRLAAARREYRLSSLL